MSVPRARLVALMKAQCDIFSTTFNPDGLRLGTKILRQRLKGPALASYYPPKGPSTKDVNKMFGEHLIAYDEDVEDAADKLAGRKLRGKGQAKKKTGPNTEKKRRK